MDNQNTVLPAVCGIFSNENPVLVLKAAGVFFHGPVENSETLYYVTLPLGWKKVQGRKPKWYRLLDHNGRTRAFIYEEKRKYINLLHRFTRARDHDLEKTSGIIVAHVYDGDRVVYTTTEFRTTKQTSFDRRYDLSVSAEEEAEKWLDANFPNWRDPGAHWD